MAPIRSVFFDFGGTLFSYKSLGAENLRTVQEAATRLGVDLPPHKIGRVFGKANAEVFARYSKQPYYLHRDVFVESFRLFAERCDRAPSDDDVEWFYETQRRGFVDNVRLRPDCVETLRAMRDDGLRLVIVSNIDDDYLAPMIERTQLADELDLWMSSEEAQSCKPDAGFFHYALERAGHAAEEVLFVGDSLVHDIAGARAVGMATALIRDHDAPEPDAGQLEGREPDHQVTSLAELLPIVRGR